MKLVIVAILLAVVASLGSALFSMTREAGSSRSMVRALTLRVALSVTLFVVLIASWQMGLIEPRGPAG